MSSQILQGMKNNSIRNYIVPGLTSSLIGGNGHGCVRLFEASREQHQAITPHSHRFDFSCLVLAGCVRNTIWSLDHSEGADEYQLTTVEYGGSAGEYTEIGSESGYFVGRAKVYYASDWYSMSYDEIHSIVFSCDAKVLFFEGRQRSHRSVVLEPIVDGERIPTLKTEPWMFQVTPPEQEPEQ